MSVEQRSWRQLQEALVTSIGPDNTDTLLSYLPPTDWDEIATTHDVQAVRGEMETLGVALRGEIAALGTELRGEIAELRGEIATLRTELRGEIAALRTELRGEIAELRGEMTGLRGEMTAMESRLHAEIVTLGADLRGEISAAITAQNRMLAITLVTSLIAIVGVVIALATFLS